ncbi:MAG: EamA family transporter [Rhizobiales bacterium]|nr:EamA family transporter [Hyphomicrobiales bacterium]
MGRLAIIGAVTLQAIGKVAYGTWLESFPAPLFVFISFTFTASFFLLISRQGRGEIAWGTLALLNIATALTFLSLFYALKLVEPSIVGAVEIAIGPLVAVLIAWVASRKTPSRTNVVVCFGILTGCAILSVSALMGPGLPSGDFSVLIGLAASSVAGIGAVLITIGSKSLLNRGWKIGAVLAHRFYVIVPLSLALSFGAETTSIIWSAHLVLVVLIVSVISVLAPLYLLQIGIGRCTPYTVLVTMSALPVLTFAIEGFSSRYEWSPVTAIGLIVITATVLWDVSTKKT